MPLPAPAREVLEGGEQTEISSKTRIQKLTKSTRTRKDAPTIANGNTTSNSRSKAANLSYRKEVESKWPRPAPS